jgi:hypothetical protein
MPTVWQQIDPACRAQDPGNNWGKPSVPLEMTPSDCHFGMTRQDDSTSGLVWHVLPILPD